MADSAVAISAGSGTNIDTRTEATNGNHRQVVVLGDPATNAGVAPVDATSGLKVDLGADNDVTITSGTITAVTSITNALPAGTNAIGKLAANSGVDIGDVDITSIAAGDNNIGNVDIVSLPASTNTIEVVGDAAENAAAAGNPLLTGGRYDSTPRTLGDGDVGALALDADGALQISDGGNSITVDGSLTVDLGANNDVTVTSGSITADLGATDNAVLDNIDADTSAIQTAVELIDDATYVDDADWTADTSKHTLVGAVTQVATTANTDGDVTPLTTNAFRELRVAYPESDLATAGTAHVKKYYTNAGAVTDGIIWSPAAGKRWYVTDIFINVSAAATVTLEDDLAGGDSAVWKAELAANSGWSHSFSTPLFSGEDAADLIVTTSAGNVYITVTGYEI